MKYSDLEYCYLPYDAGSRTRSETRADIWVYSRSHKTMVGIWFPEPRVHGFQNTVLTTGSPTYTTIHISNSLVEQVENIAQNMDLQAPA